MATAKIAVVDYHKGNLSSVIRGLVRAGADAFSTDDPKAIESADGIVVPGVGSFYDAAVFMKESGQAEAILNACKKDTPLLGICLGLQLLFDSGDEGIPEDCGAVSSSSDGADLSAGDVFESNGSLFTRGLGLIKGTCVKLKSESLKIPHVGWDQVYLTKEGFESQLMDGFAEGSNMYFTHSYVASDCEEDCTLGKTHYAQSFPCVVGKGNVFGVQFHPEKSSSQGLLILNNFVNIVREAK
ncbi:MAG: imidazole glycerol phosphate synthase subunit HisH [Phoenicibacter congonensis]|uniref:Imidazole glycerol phosphate synthase subunit HisH n=1 Tax=Phoenicibacter congonensis TaxID=1944646 RepID=A0AA43RHL4_9ACTN|nr:imidazole glycerol phosphate synthase subunit HisH [Phoenicibacter congonensis]